MVEECPTHSGDYDELAADPAMNGIKKKVLDLGPGFTQHGSNPELLARAGLDAQSVAAAALNLIREETT